MPLVAMAGILAIAIQVVDSIFDSMFSLFKLKPLRLILEFETISKINLGLTF